MAFYKVLHKFKGIKENQTFTPDGSNIEFTVKRATEINKNTQAKWGVDVLERVEEDKSNADDLSGSTETETLDNQDGA